MFSIFSCLTEDRSKYANTNKVCFSADIDGARVISPRSDMAAEALQVDDDNDDNAEEENLSGQSLVD